MNAPQLVVLFCLAIGAFCYRPASAKNVRRPRGARDRGTAVNRTATKDPPELPDFPNINYLGMSYDIVKGNPNPTIANGAKDNGWSNENLFTFTYKDNNNWAGPTTTWRYPDNMTVRNEGSCAYAVQYTEIRSAYEYQQSMKKDLSIEANASFLGIEASFSASTDYQEASKATGSEDKVYITAKAVCEEYTAEFQLPYIKLPQPSTYFKNAVETLPTEVNNDTMPALIAFATHLGTHYTTSINMGGKATFTMVFDKAAHSSLMSRGIDVEAAADVSYGVFGGVSAKDQTQANQQNYNAFTKTHFEEKKSCLGGSGNCPVLSADAGGSVAFNPDWADKVASNPLPHQFTLELITELLTSDMFKDDANITLKRAALTTFYNDHYCGSVVTCAPPVPSEFWGAAAELGTAAPPSSGAPVIQLFSYSMASLPPYLYAQGNMMVTGSMMRYDAVRNGWTGRASISTFAPGQGSTTGMGMAAHNMTIYNQKQKFYLYGVGGCCGGPNKISTLAIAQRYDPSADKWETVASMGTPRQEFCLASLGAYLYAVGGINDNYPYLSTAERYDPNADKWAPVASMGTTRAYFGLSSLGPYLYAAGGCNGDGTTAAAIATMERFDPSENKWAPVASMSVGRTGLGLATLGNFLYAAGGYTGVSCALGNMAGHPGSILATVERFDGSTWTPVVSMATPRMYFGFAALPPYLFATGGCTHLGNEGACQWFLGQGSFVSTVEAFTDDNVTATALQLA